MTSRDAVRTAVIIGGLWLVFSALAAVPQAFANLPLAIGNLREGGSGIGTAPLWAFLAILVGIVLFGVLPGVYVVQSSEVWASRLVRADDSSTEIQPSLILAVGVMVFGFSLGVSGAVLVAGSLISLPALFMFAGESGISWPEYFQGAIHGALSFLAGVLSFRWGSRGVLRAA